MTVPRAHVSHNVPATSVCISEKRSREKGLGDELLMLESEPRWKTYESGGLPGTPQITLWRPVEIRPCMESVPFSMLG